MEFIIQHRTEIKDFLIEMTDKAQSILDQEQTFNILKTKNLKAIDDFVS